MDPNKELSIVSNEAKMETNFSSPHFKPCVQIQTSKNEVQRRINTFCALKRKDINRRNIREYSGREPIEEDHPFWDHINSCARVDAVYIPCFWKRRRITGTRTENICTPHSRNDTSVKSTANKSPIPEVNKKNTISIPGVKERLRVMELHLKLKSKLVIRNDIFARLNQVENRILLLEGLTPEYFISTNLEKEDIHPVDKELKENSEEQNKELEALVNGRLLIMCDSDEMQKRISAIIARNRKSKDVSNIRQYCHLEPVEEDHPLWGKINTCAREDAKFIHHLKCKNISEQEGAEKDLDCDDIINQTKQKIEDAEESQQNADMFFLYKPDQSTRRKVFSKLKELENRILHLMNSSPNSLRFLVLKYSVEQDEVRTKEKPQYSDWTANEMKQRIQQLKVQLCQKKL